jgi:hypothetical protein
MLYWLRLMPEHAVLLHARPLLPVLSEISISVNTGAAASPWMVIAPTHLFIHLLAAAAAAAATAASRNPSWSGMARWCC